MSFETMARDVLPIVRGAPPFMIVNELREAAIAFFGRTQAWLETLDPATISAGHQEIELDIPSGAALATTVAVAMDGRRLIPGRDFSVDTDGVLVLPGPLPRDVTIVATVALKPTYSALSLPSEIEGKYRAAIIFGAVARLKTQAGTEWADPQGAAMYYELFKQEMATARRRAFQGVTGASMRVAPVSFL